MLPAYMGLMRTHDGQSYARTSAHGTVDRSPKYGSYTAYMADTIPEFVMLVILSYYMNPI